MNELVVLKKDDVFTNSLVIAEGTGNEHRAVKQLIRSYEREMKVLGAFDILNVESLKSTGGRPEQYYPLNEQQATFLITLLRNTSTVVAFKLELVKEFYKMRQFIMEKQSKQWIETRYAGKLTRKSETDTIKKLVEYAKEQGSKHPDKLYVVYSKLANKIAGIQQRDSASITQLNNLTLIENIILRVIEEGIKANETYKAIYANCKTKLEVFQDIAYLAS